METTFVFPLKFDDLCAYDSNKYCVETTYTEDEVSGLVHDCVNDFTEEGPDFILNRFDVFYSVIK